MKLIVASVGAVVSGIICFVVFSLISMYQISQLGYTPSQSDRLIDIFIVVTPLLSLAGGWLSVTAYKNRLKN